MNCMTLERELAVRAADDTLGQTGSVGGRHRRPRKILVDFKRKLALSLRRSGTFRTPRPRTRSAHVRIEVVLPFLAA